ncbi:tyrosine-type recombinase/integrase [Paraburkholderia caribensis]|uniref:tyrosine-type recombinase/integrase n=1 Tax=Paraburkholderia caribensis TaxID=75105 RepID=UPI0034D17E2F
MSDIPVARLAPVETLSVPRQLDGREGTNRADPSCAQIAAANDLDAVRAWLTNFVDKKTTFENYRKEGERLLLWALVELGKPLSSLTHEDLLRYRAFLLNPQPVERWISATGGKFSRTDSRWRPFNGPLSAASQRQAMVVLNAMFTWLVSAGYLKGNPIALVRNRSKPVKRNEPRHLSSALWNEVTAFVANLPRETAREKALADRSRWLVTLFYLQGLRVSEVAGGRMAQFFRRLTDGGKEQWWLEVTGKGDKIRIVPVSQELVSELTRYREAAGLPARPSPDDQAPLVLPLAGTTRNLSRSALHDAIKSVFRGTAAWIRMRGPEQHALAAELDRASAHWLRHTAGTRMADGGVDLRAIRDNFGHSSINTTSIYLHAEDDERHRQTVEKHRIGWAAAEAGGGNGSN